MLTMIPTPGNPRETTKITKVQVQRLDARSTLVSPVSCTVYYRAVLFTIVQYRASRLVHPSIHSFVCSFVRSFEKADIIENVIAESGIKAGSASFLCKSEDGASQTSFHHVDNVAVAWGSCMACRPFAIKHWKPRMVPDVFLCSSSNLDRANDQEK